VSRGFKNRIKAKQEMIEAVSFYANRAAEKARIKKVFAFRVHVFIKTDPYGDNRNSYSAGQSIILDEAHNDARTIIKAALEVLESIYKPKFSYQKAGIILTGLVYDTERQISLFGGGQSHKLTRLMETMDIVNKIHGRETIRPAVVGTNKKWFMARNMLSPRYTTQWKELRKVRS
jgi:DNA polymerase V